jgi:catechol 2,3-dioxygenase-like lactoylglutathione lyase family enzyme
MAGKKARARVKPKARTKKMAPKKAAPRNKPPRIKPPRIKPRTLPETLRLKSFTPSITVNDLSRSLAFYTDGLGFIVSERWAHGDVLQGVMLKAGTCELGLAQDDWKLGKDRKKGQGLRIWCDTTQDVDVIAARLKAAGFPLTEEPEDRPAWGVRSFSVDDPDGFHLTIARNL